MTEFFAPSFAPWDRIFPATEAKIARFSTSLVHIRLGWTELSNHCARGVRTPSTLIFSRFLILSPFYQKRLFSIFFLLCFYNRHIFLIFNSETREGQCSVWKKNIFFVPGQESRRVGQTADITLFRGWRIWSFLCLRRSTAKFPWCIKIFVMVARIHLLCRHKNIMWFYCNWFSEIFNTINQNMTWFLF